MGVVYRAVHTETGQPAAVKVSLVQERGALDAIRREIQGLSRLSHPGISRILDHGVHEGQPWMAMELIEGPSLEQVLSEVWAPLRVLRADVLPAGGGQLGRLLGIVRQVCQTLAYLHGEGIVHRDLKPANILLRDGGLPVLVDFGISHEAAGASGREDLDRVQAVSGTPAYIAPEQLRGAPPDARMDLYALGCILYAAVCGRPPFVQKGRSVVRQHLSSDPEPPSVFVDGVPDLLEGLLLQLLEKEPRDRPGHAGDVGVLLAELGAASSPLLSRPAPKPYLYRAPFAGQEAALDGLREALADAVVGEGRSTVLLGPSGSGKTRLLLELTDDARRERITVITAECTAAVTDDGPSAPAGGPLGAFLPLLGAVAEACVAQGAAATDALLGRHLPVLAALDPRLWSVPGADAYPAPPHLVGRDAAERVQRAVVDTIVAWSARTPSLIIIDDLQWADDLSLGALGLLARDPPERLSAAVVLACRAESLPEEVDALRALPSTGELTVEPLGEADIIDIAEGMTATEGLPGALVDFLLAHSGGSPLVVSEYLRAAVGEGILVRQGSRWTLDAAEPHRFSEADRLPERRLEALARVDGVEALMSMRLAHLGDRAARLLRAGAVWGRCWQEADAAQTAGLSSSGALEAVATLLARQVVVETGDGGLRFAHDRLRETVIANTPDDERARLHVAVARALEHQGAADVRAIARHYRLGGVDQQAFRYSAKAGRQALRQGAYREAIEELRAALRLATAPGTAVESSVMERARLHHHLGDALYVAGDLLAMGDHLSAGVDVLGVMRTPRTERAWGLRALRDVVHRVLVAVLPARLSVVRGERRSRVAETGYLLSRLSEPYIYSNRTVAYLGTNLAASLHGARSQDSEIIAWVDVVLGTAVTAMGLSGLARRLVGNARRHAGLCDNSDVQLYQAQIEAYFWHLEVEWDRATETVDAALERGRALGTSFRTEQILIVSALVRRVSGALPRSIADARELVRSARTWGHWLNEALGEMLLGLALVGSGETEEAREALSVASRMMHKPHLAVQRANCHAGLAAAALIEGDLEAALREVTLVEEMVPGLAPSNLVAGAIHKHVPQVRLAALEAARAAGAPTARLEALTVEVVKRATRFCRIARSAEPIALRHQAHLAALQGHPERARKRIAQSLEAAQRLRLPLEAAEALLLQARLAPGTAAASLASARELFEQIGLPRRAARCNALPPILGQ